MAVAGSEAQAAIFERDDRIGVEQGGAGLRGVGVVSASPTSSYGTAFLIDACHALSARHMVHRAEAIGQRLTVQFEPWRASTRANSAVGTVVATGGTPRRRSDVSQDWILLRLDRCLGATLGFLPLSKMPLAFRADRRAIGPDLKAIGFPHDRAVERGPTIDPLCAVRMISSFGLLHDCATLPGNSGGPLIAWNAAMERYEVMAINVAGHDRATAERFDAEAANMAVSIESILPAILATIRAEIERERQRGEPNARPLAPAS